MSWVGGWVAGWVQGQDIDELGGWVRAGWVQGQDKTGLGWLSWGRGGARAGLTELGLGGA